ncbi:MAG: hypothetical protein WC369_09755 [Dehalococcoidales bacterium]|jgi:predicted nucleic acid-binding protein
MSRIRKIHRNLVEGRNYFLIDTNFLVNKHIPPAMVPSSHHKRRVEKCISWWDEIDAQIQSDKARIYVPDICIAEAYKVLAEKYYKFKWFKNWRDYQKAKISLTNQISTSVKELAKYDRKILCHDISTSRDLIISVDRFFEVCMKKELKVQIADLILLATAKYMVDFYDMPAKRIHIVTLDHDLRTCAKYITELPYVYDPTESADTAVRVFTD